MSKVRTADCREAYDRELRTGRGGVDFNTPPAPAAAGKPYAANTPGRPLDFGRYEGLTVAQIARRDMDYLRWLAGMRPARGSAPRSRRRSGPGAPAKPKA